MVTRNLPVSHGSLNVSYLLGVTDGELEKLHSKVDDLTVQIIFRVKFCGTHLKGAFSLVYASMYKYTPEKAATWLNLCES